MAVENEIVELPDCECDTTCNICYAEFLDREDLEIHLKQMHFQEYKSNRFCQFCLSLYPSLAKYVQHLLEKHLMSMICCKYCLRAFVDMLDYRTHESLHRCSDESILLCSQCKMRFTNMIDLEQHEYEDHTEIRCGALLHDCLQIMSSYLNMNAKVFLQSLGKEAVYICTNCHYTSAQLNPYLKHLKANQCVSYVCNTCCNVYKKKISLRKHVLTCEENVAIKSKIETCINCFKRVDKALMKKHKKSCDIFKCKKCFKVFENTTQFADHHLKEHPASLCVEKCKFCTREFTDKAILKKHIEKIHKSSFHLFKYLCKHCSAVFAHPKKLFAHYFTRHKEIQPYTCKICNKTYRVRKGFTLHIKMEHKSIGFVEFDNNYNVFFASEKSDQPFMPTCVLASNGELLSEFNTGKEVDTVETVTENDQSAKTSEEMDKGVQKPEIDLVYVNSDFMDPTETEGNQTDTETDKKKKTKRKRKVAKPKIVKSEEIESDDSDDQPLLQIKRKKYRSNKMGKTKTKSNGKKFTCNICSKYCYTYLNYMHHLSLHRKNEAKKCIKCNEVFKSKAALNEHVSQAHSSSKLTDTLKSLLERRKMNYPLTSTQKFQKTFRKVHIQHCGSSAKITLVKEGESVKNFFQSFTPEEKAIEISNSVTIKALKHAVKKTQVIKMNKFEKPIPQDTPPKLAMPVKFREINETHTVTVKVLSAPAKREVALNFGNIPQEEYQYEALDDTNDHYEEIVEGNEVAEPIPEVAQEVMLAEENKPNVQSQFVLQNLPAEYDIVSIAHLQSEAPYYKIVKLKDVLDVEEPETPAPNIILPDGKKLVSVNPLGHLIGDKELRERATPKSKTQNKKSFENAVAKALLELENPSARKKKYTRKKTKE